MKQIHLQEKEQFKILFKQEDIDRFEDRFIILELFLQTEQHLTLDQLSDYLKEKGHRFDHDFIRETMKLMCQFGFARKNRFENGTVRYEHRHLGQHHDHMICTKCGNIFEFENVQMEHLQDQIAASHGFHMLQHKMEIYGICGACLKDRIKEMPLRSAKQGERLEIRNFIGGAGARMRLMSMGLRIGDSLEVISNLSDGQMVVAVGTKRFVLGKGLSNKIRVRRIAEMQPTATPAASTSTTEMQEFTLPLPMSEMKEGQRGKISRVGGNGALRRRLLEMGLLKGADIYIEKYAPLKDPLELVVKGYHISLRVEEAAEILVDDVS